MDAPSSPPQRMILNQSNMDWKFSIFLNLFTPFDHSSRALVSLRRHSAVGLEYDAFKMLYL
jgi:hypothetical protein